jgi:ATP-binding cassette subfamily B protein
VKKDNLKAVLRYTRGYRLPIIVGFVLLFCELVISFVQPLVMSVTIDSVLGTKPLSAPWYFSWLINALGGIETIKRNIWIMAATIVSFQLILGVVRYFKAQCNNVSGEGIVKSMRDRLYAHIQRLPYAWHAGAQTGDIIQRATNDMETVRRFFNTMMQELVRTVVMLVVGIFVMFTLSVPLTLITVVLVIPVVVISIVYFRRISKLTTVQEEAEGKLFAVIQENLTGTRVVRAFGRQAFEMEKFDAKNEENRKKTFTVIRAFAGLWSTLDGVCGLELTAVLVVGILLVVNGDLTVGAFTAFTSYVFLFFWPIRGFGRALNDFSRTLVAAGRIEEVMKAKEEEDLDTGLTPDLNGDIVFRDVSFAYDTVPVLKDLNMTIPGGATVAFLGGTGSGKSSVSLLLQRLYDIQSGTITVGGTDIKEVKKTHLRSRIGIVLQEPYLYSKSILKNIGIKFRDPVPDEVREAAVSAAIHDDVMSFEDGYETLVGERGVTLSGGQKQRVAIARSLMGKSDVLIFDDSLSAVDTKTDAAIRETLTKRRQNVTTIIISHRITTLMEADKIFVLKDGRITEEGNHAELMALGGIYKRTYDIQSANIEEGSDA